MSSLIFVVILAVWAVYLVQHWVRRRDHLATARSVDRFSEAMRVLERRRALPRPDLGEHAPRAYSVSPLRPARPEVVVKRGGAAARDGAAAAAPAGAVATAVGPTPAFRRSRLLARLRAVGLLIASVVMVGTVGAAAFQLVHWGWSFAGVGALALTVYAVRWSVSRSEVETRGTRRPATPQRAAATARAGAHRPAPARRQRVAPHSGVGARRREVAATLEDRATDSPLVAQAVAAVTATGTAAATTTRTTAAPARTARGTARRRVDLTAQRPALYDIDAVEAELVAPAGGSAARGHGLSGPGAGMDVQFAAPDVAAEHPEPVVAGHGMLDDGPAVQRETDAQHEPAPGTWSPVPVPPPTYTLKAKAYRPAQPTWTGSPQLPVDGNEMALDEEFEELPRIDRVG